MRTHLILTASEAADTAIGLGLTLLIVVIALGLLVFHIVVLVDILKRPELTWQVSGQSRVLWLVLWFVGFCCGGSLIIDLIYWLVVRPKLQSPPGYGSQPGYGP